MKVLPKFTLRRGIQEIRMIRINWDWLFFRGMLIFSIILSLGLLLFGLWFWQFIF